MSQIDMKNYKINHDLFLNKNNRTNTEIQIKTKNDININNRSLSKNAFSISINKPNFKENYKNSLRTPVTRFETNINSILNGKPLTKNSESESLSKITKENFNNRLNGNLIYSVNTGKILKSSENNISRYDISTPTENQKEVSNNKNTNFNLLTNDSLFAGNFKMLNYCKNFNTISNIETEVFCSSKNKYGNSFKIFGNINTTNTINTNNCTIININNNLNIDTAFNIDENNSGMNDKKKMKSMDFEKTKSVANNKTDYKTLNSNNCASKRDTLNSAGNTRFNKFEVKLLNHFKNLKSQKSSGVCTPDYRKIIKSKKTNTSNINAQKPNSKTKKQNNLNAENLNNINILHKIINKTNILNKSNEKLTKISCVDIKINLEPEKNMESKLNYTIENTKINKNSNSVDIRFNNLSKDEDEKIKILLSEKFEFSNNNLKRINKSVNSSSSKINKVDIKRNLIKFDLDNQKENGRSLSIGERLYHRSVAMKNIKDKRASIELYKKDIETINNCSFKPKLCEDSVMLNIKILFIF